MGTSRRPELFAAASAQRPAHRHVELAFLALLGLWLGAAAARAQGLEDGAVHLRVVDASRHPMAGAEVALHSADGDGSWAAVTGADGTLLLPHLVPGSYAVAIGGQRVGAVGSDAVAVHVGETAEVRVSVSRTGALTLAEDSSPLEGEALLPDEDGDGLTSLHGLATAANGAALDGVSATQSFGAVPVGTGSDPAPDPDGDADSADLATGPAGGMARGRHAGVAYIFSQSAVREFRVAGRGYSAQAGHAGDVSMTVSHSGTSELHGSLFFGVRSQALAARSPLAIATSYADGVVSSGEVKPHDLRESFGATLGGPVPRLARLFYFASFEDQRRGFPAISSPADPNFYSLTSTQTALLANRGLTHAAVNVALNYLSSLTGQTDRRADQTNNFGRLDWRATDGLTLAAEYNRVRWNSPAGLINAPVVARGRASIGNSSGSLDQVLLHLITTWSAKTGNQLRAAYVGDVQYETPQTPLPQEPAISPGALAPEVNIGPSGLLFGTPASLSKSAYPDERRWSFSDTFTLLRGRHLVDAGVELSLVDDRVATLANGAGTFSYDSGVTGGHAGGLADFITDFTFNIGTNPNGGCPSIFAATHLFCFRSFSQSFGQSVAAFSTQEWSGFLEDTWRVLPRLTLHAGARYEYTLLPIPATPNAGLDALFGSRGATSVFPEDRNNLGPRISVAYEPFGAGRGLVRAGFGVFFGRLPGATIRSALSDTGQATATTTTRIRIRPNTSVPCPQAPAQGFGYPCVFTAQPPGTVAATTSAVVFDRRFRLPVVEQGSLSLERSVVRGTTLTATYVFNLDRQLPGSTDLNIVPATSVGTFQLHGGTGINGVTDGETFRVPVYTSRVTPSFGPVTDIVSNVNATYHGLTLAVDSRALPSLRIHAAYTWSKAIDFGQNQSATPRTDGQFDPFTHGYDKGLSALNYPWSLRLNAAWNPTLRRGPTSLRRAANSWDVAPILTARSGRPYSLDLSGGTFLPGGHLSLNGSGGALYLPTVGRDTLRLPANVNLDLRVSRGFRAGTRVQVFTSIEAFNLTNHRNVSSVNQRAFLVGTAVAGVTPLIFQDAAALAAEGLNQQPFGTATGAGTSLARERQLQLNLRVAF